MLLQTNWKVPHRDPAITAGSSHEADRLRASTVVAVVKVRPLQRLTVGNVVEGPTHAGVGLMLMLLHQQSLRVGQHALLVLLLPEEVGRAVQERLGGQRAGHRWDLTEDFLFVLGTVFYNNAFSSVEPCLGIEGLHRWWPVRTPWFP